MEIIILGDNEVANGLTETLSKEEHNVTLVSTDADQLETMREECDIRTILGMPSYPDILSQAGAADADMLVAVTDNDEVNMVACEVAHALYDTPMKVARIRAKEYLDTPSLFGDGVVAIDVTICPEQMVTNHLSRLITYPGATQVYNFADGEIRMILIRPYYGGVLIGKSLVEISEYLEAAVRVVSIFRDGKSLNLTGSTIIETGDQLLFLCASEDIKPIMQALGRFEHNNKHIMIAGGGNIGLRLAEALEEKYDVKVIDHNHQRTKHLANNLSSAIVLEGDVSDKKLLLNENIESMDVFCAVTSDDEANIMSCMQAKRLGVRNVVALVKQAAYVDLIDNSEIDIVISPQKIMIGSILAHIRRGDITKVYSLPIGTSEVLELVVHGNNKTSKAVGKAVNALKLPKGTSVAGIMRDNNTLLLQRDTIIEPDDKVLIFVEQSKCVAKIEDFFQVSATFI